MACKGRPCYALDVFRSKEVVNQKRTVTRRIIIHEYEVRTDSTSKRANLRLKNLVSVSFTSHRPRFKEMKACATVQHDACPYYYSPRWKMMYSDYVP